MNVSYHFKERHFLEGPSLLYFLRSANHFCTLLSLACLTTRAILRIDRSPAFGEQTVHSHMIVVGLPDEEREWRFDLCEGGGW